MEIKGKTVLVTGAAGSLGSVMVNALCATGAHVLALDKDEAALSALEDARISKLLCDISKAENVKHCLEEVYSQHQVIDILINNAGILHSAPLVSLSGQGDEAKILSDWQCVIDTNLSSVFYMSRVVAKKMVRSRTKGIIINISSVCAAGNAGQSAYSASKAGVEALTQVWAKELGGLGIRCVAIAPGFIDAPSTRRAVSEANLKELSSRIPLRKLGNPEGIWQAVRYAIENDYVTGTVLEVDGGLKL